MESTRQIISPVIYTVAGLFSLRRLVRMTGQPLLLPYYHIVSDRPPAHVRHLYPVPSVQRFKADLDYLLQHYQPVGLEALRLVADGRAKLHKPAFMLSFDDGFRECADVVAPLLQEKGVPAVFFVNPAFVDNRGLMYRCRASLLIDRLKAEASTKLHHKVQEVLKEHGFHSILDVNYRQQEALRECEALLEVDVDKYLNKTRPYMTWKQLKALKKQGFGIGAHSMDHPDYRLLSLEDQLRKTRQSLKVVDDKVAPVHRAFSFPFTDTGVIARFFRELYKDGDLLTFGGAGLKQDISPHHFHRLWMEQRLPAQAIVKQEYAAYLLKRLAGCTEMKR